MVNKSIIMTYGGLSTREYRAIVTAYSGASVPERVSESIEIPGRNGNLSLDGGRYKNIDISYGLYFHGRREAEAYRAAIGAITGYQRLQNSYESDEFRQAKLKTPQFSALGMHALHAEASLTFDCKPQRYLTVGERPLEFTASNPNALWNLGSMPAKPLIRVYGYGTLGVGGSTITIAEHGKAYVDIDSDIQDCYCGTENLNPYITLSRQTFPELKVGMTGLTMDDGITKVIVYPRWWRL